MKNILLVGILFSTVSEAATIQQGLACLANITSSSADFCRGDISFSVFPAEINEVKDNNGGTFYYYKEAMSRDGLDGVRVISMNDTVFFGIDPKTSNCDNQPSASPSCQNFIINKKLALKDGPIVGDQLSLFYRLNKGKRDRPYLSDFSFRENSPVLKFIGREVRSFAKLPDPDIATSDETNLKIIRSKDLTNESANHLESVLRNKVSGIANSFLTYLNNPVFSEGQSIPDISKKCSEEQFIAFKKFFIKKLISCKQLLNDEKWISIINPQIKTIAEYEYPLTKKKNTSKTKEAAAIK
ncbi:MAG: hypothetical protein ACXVCP_18400 [Bdellovibrio sp.]